MDCDVTRHYLAGISIVVSGPVNSLTGGPAYQPIQSIHTMQTTNQTGSVALNKRTQEILLLTMALHQKGGGGSKRETLRFIERGGWYVTCRSDFEQCGNGCDFKFENSLAWARKDAVTHGLVSDKHRDFWRLLDRGLNLLVKAKEKFASGAWDISTCYLWSAELKGLYSPDYEPSERDWHRTASGFAVPPLVHLEMF